MASTTPATVSAANSMCLIPTTNEATLVADFQLGTGGSFPQEFTVVDGKLYFTAMGNDGTPEGNVGKELYVIDPDGRPGPHPASPISTPVAAAPRQASLTALGDKLYFSASGPQGDELYVIDPAVGPDPGARRRPLGQWQLLPERPHGARRQALFHGRRRRRHQQHRHPSFTWSIRTPGRSSLSPKPTPATAARIRADSRRSTARFISPPRATTPPTASSAASFTSTIRSPRPPRSSPTSTSPRARAAVRQNRRRSGHCGPEHRRQLESDRAHGRRRQALLHGSRL